MAECPLWSINSIPLELQKIQMITSQQNIALGLTKLVLEHCVEDKISKEELFDFLKTQNEDIV
jgi:translation elongation factor EF-1beta